MTKTEVNTKRFWSQILNVQIIQTIITHITPTIKGTFSSSIIMNAGGSLDRSAGEEDMTYT